MRNLFYIYRKGTELLCVLCSLMELVISEFRFHALIMLMSVDLQIFKTPSVLMVLPARAAAACLLYFPSAGAVAGLSVSHQIPRWLYGNCSNISVSNGPGHVQNLIKIWLKYPLLFVRWSQARALRWALHYVCCEMSVLSVKPIVRHPGPQPHANLCWRRPAFSWLSVVHLPSRIDWWLSKWKWCLLSFKT